MRTRTRSQRRRPIRSTRVPTRCFKMVRSTFSSRSDQQKGKCWCHAHITIVSFWSKKVFLRAFVDARNWFWLCEEIRFLSLPSISHLFGELLWVVIIRGVTSYCVDLSQDLVLPRREKIWIQLLINLRSHFHSMPLPWLRLKAHQPR